MLTLLQLGFLLMCRSREISGSVELLKALVFPGKKGGAQPRAAQLQSVPGTVHAPPGIALLFSQPDPSTLLLLISAKHSLRQK